MAFFGRELWMHSGGLGGGIVEGCLEAGLVKVMYGCLLVMRHGCLVVMMHGCLVVRLEDSITKEQDDRMMSRIAALLDPCHVEVGMQSW